MGRYGWLGSKQRSTDAFDRVVLMGVRPYNPVLGRFLQTDPLPGGSANAYDYVNQDPINNFDLDGRFCGPRCQWKKHKHTIINIGVGAIAGFGAAACVATVVCGVGAFVIGSVALGTAGVAAHTAADGRRGFGRSNVFTNVARTLSSETRGLFCGVTFGSGCLGVALRRGRAKPGFPGLAWRRGF